MRGVASGLQARSERRTLVIIDPLLADAVVANVVLTRTAVVKVHAAEEGRATGAANRGMHKCVGEPRA